MTAGGEPARWPAGRLLAGEPGGGRSGDGHLADRRLRRPWVPRIAGLLVLVTALAIILVGIDSGLYLDMHLYPHSRLHRISGAAPFTLGFTSSLSRLALIVIGLLLVMLSHGLRRRKHRAWQEAMALLIAAAAVNSFRLRHIFASAGHSMMPFGLALTALLVGLGWHFRSEFYATGDPRSRWRALGVFLGLFTADIVIGLAYIAPRGLSGTFSMAQRIQSVLYGLVGATGPVQFSSAQEARGDFFGIMTGALGLLTAVVTAYVFLRPAEPRGRLSAQDAEGVRKLLDAHGDGDSLGYFALRDDKSVIWSASRKSCIGYRVLSGVMLAAGDPLGDPEAWPGAIAEFLDESARHAWVPAVIGCSERGAEVWCRNGALTALELGDEAIISTPGFSVQGRAMRNVRQMVSRVRRAGYVAEVRRVGDLSAQEIAGLVRQAGSWRGNPTERGFSMALGRVGGAGDQACVIATASCDGEVRALLHLVPWGTDGLSLDLMRRDRSAQPGLNDFLIVETIKASQNLGIKRISLNFAVFRAALERGERIGAGPVLRVWRRILLFLSRWFQIESLYKFNAKFSPEWIPRFMVFPGTRDALRIGLAVLEAEAFLVWPTIEARRLARKVRDALRPSPRGRTDKL